MKQIKSSILQLLITIPLLTITVLHLTACEHQNNLPPSGSVTLVAVGDIMLGGTAEEILIKNSYNYPFLKVKHLLQHSDIVIGNLEGPLTCLSESPIEKQYLFRSPPDLVAPALQKAGFNLLNLANNHILDFGIQGMNDTLEALHKYNIQTVGTGNNLTAARAGKIMHTANGSIGFVSYSLTFPDSFWATEDKAGAAFGHKKDIEEDVLRISKLVDYVVVSFHWGKEKSLKLRPYQQRLGHAAIDAGADVVLGHHPHVLQGIEEYNDGLIIYSLGNFVFGSYSTAAEFSIIARITLHKNKYHSAEFTPINVLNTEVIFQPYPLTGTRASTVIKHINHLSESLNTKLIQTNDKGFLHTAAN